MQIEMRGIDKAFGSNQVLKNAGFELRDGEIHALMGENGAGKSTLMNQLYGMFKPSSGDILVNGKKIEFTGKGSLDRSFITADLNGLLKEGVNEIIYELDFYQSEHVYFVLSDVTPEKESLKNCLSYDTELESIYIRGDFGVYDDNLKHESGVAYVSNGEHYIAKSRKSLFPENFIKQGLLFFAGKVELEKDLVIDKSASMLKVGGRRAVVEVFVDGEYVKMLMFDFIIFF